MVRRLIIMALGTVLVGGILAGCSSEATSEELTDVYKKREEDAKKLGAGEVTNEQAD